MSDEQKTEEELESEDDTEAHFKVPVKAQDDPEDDGPEVEGHFKVPVK